MLGQIKYDNPGEIHYLADHIRPRQNGILTELWFNVIDYLAKHYSYSWQGHKQTGPRLPCESAIAKSTRNFDYNNLTTAFENTYWPGYEREIADIPGVENPNDYHDQALDAFIKHGLTGRHGMSMKAAKQGFNEYKAALPAIIADERASIPNQEPVSSVDKPTKRESFLETLLSRSSNFRLRFH